MRMHPIRVHVHTYAHSACTYMKYVWCTFLHKNVALHTGKVTCGVYIKRTPARIHQKFCLFLIIWKVLNQFMRRRNVFIFLRRKYGTPLGRCCYCRCNYTVVSAAESTRSHVIIRWGHVTTLDVNTFRVMTTFTDSFIVAWWLFRTCRRIRRAHVPVRFKTTAIYSVYITKSIAFLKTRSKIN